MAAATGGMHGFVPALTSFVGRESDVEQLARLLGEYRLVTVTGPGGVGKTRLASEVARQVAARFADGAWLLELAAVRDPALVPAAIATALGIPQGAGPSLQETLATVLARRQMLLVLDNCEHVLGATSELCASLLPRADDLTVLATSREPLGIGGETRYRLSPLPLPDPAAAGQGQNSAAVQLFTERARQADPSFDLDVETTRLVDRLVTRLDGMPLAIELAATRLEALGLPQMLDRPQLLASASRGATGRQQSVTATIDWSYQLLPEDMQRAFRQLAIFPGPFSLEAAEEIIGATAGPAVLHLVTCSLLTPPRLDPDGRSRYVMLETLRAFGREHLTGAGEEAEADAALTRHALKVAESAVAGLRTSTADELPATRWLDAETSAVQQALDWSLKHDPASALRLVTALFPWWQLRGRLEVAYASLRAATSLAHPGSDLWCTLQLFIGEAVEETGRVADAHIHYSAAHDAAAERGPSRILADAQSARAHLMANMVRTDEASDLARASLAMSRELGYVTGQVTSLLELGYAAFNAGQAAAALPYFRQASQLSKAGPAEVPGTLSRTCDLLLTNILRQLGHGDAARRVGTDVLSRTIAADDTPNQALACHLMADLERRAGNGAAGAARLSEALRLCRQSGADWQVANCLEICGHLCADNGRWADAVSAWSASTALLLAAGSAVNPLDADARRPLLQHASQVLGAGQLRSAEERGASMSAETAAEFALVLCSQDPDASPGQPDIPQLTVRERELVTLVARGSTDAQIAGQLFIAVSTVRSHLDRIRDKTSCRRRADLTRLALQAGLV